MLKAPINRYSTDTVGQVTAAILVDPSPHVARVSIDISANTQPIVSVATLADSVLVNTSTDMLTDTWSLHRRTLCQPIS